MKLADAEAAAPLVAQILALTAIMAQINLAITEHWPITSLKVSAPDQGSSMPAGTTIDVLVMGKAATDANSQLALQTALATYQSALDALNAQLAAI